MDCSKCEEKAVITGPARCKKHFIEHFEARVHETIERFKLIRPGEKICVAASGGKDSLALLHVLKEKYPVDVLSVDEGIPGYRDKTLDDLRDYCTKHNLNLRVVSFEDLGTKPLSDHDLSHPCSTCGVLRRKALLDYSSEYDIIATGHNLDDEGQSIMMNVLCNHTRLMSRMGPRTASADNIAARVKPFFLTPEREVRAYCILKGVSTNFTECPHIVKSFRWDIQEMLNRLEQKRNGTKLALVEKFLATHYEPFIGGGICDRCNGPSSDVICKACKIITTTTKNAA